MACFVSILLIEFLSCYPLRKHPSQECHYIVKLQSDPLQEQSKVLATAMTKMVIFLKLKVQMLQVERGRPNCQTIDLLERDVGTRIELGVMWSQVSLVGL